MNDYIIYSAVILAMVFISACSQILLKKAALISWKSKLAEYLNWRVILAYFIFLIAAVVNFYVLRYIPLSLVPILESAAFIFIPLLSLFLLKEKLKPTQYIGIILIISGIVVFSL
ncbi:MAG: EamA family transporter [Oscillospiraceae bacterium]|nr:EamA family transporter [Oscillospiraceae bacterium]MCL2278477.1 EamA family transporter [Oscillospiraceae bacterium]